MQDILFKTCISGYVDLTRTYPAITFPDNCEWQLFQFTDFPQIMKTSINSSEIPILYCPDIFYLRYETYEPGNYSGTGFCKYYRLFIAFISFCKWSEYRLCVIFI